MQAILKLCCILLLSTPLTASTGNIQGVIVSIDGGTFTVKGVNHYGKPQSGDVEHKIPNKGSPIYILDGHITTKGAALKVGRKAFVFWNRQQQHMVVVNSNADEKGITYPTGPVPSGVYVNTTQGILASATQSAIVLKVHIDGKEAAKKIPLKKGKTEFILDTTFGSTFDQVCIPGKKIVAFCYRNRNFPNFVVTCSTDSILGE